MANNGDQRLRWYKAPSGKLENDMCTFNGTSRRWVSNKTQASHFPTFDTPDQYWDKLIDDSRLKLEASIKNVQNSLNLATIDRHELDRLKEAKAKDLEEHSKITNAEPAAV